MEERVAVLDLTFTGVYNVRLRRDDTTYSNLVGYSVWLVLRVHRWADEQEFVWDTTYIPWQIHG